MTKSERADTRPQQKAGEKCGLTRAALAACCLFSLLGMPGWSSAAAQQNESASDADSTETRARGLDAPTWVMGRSALIPGWGQAKNGAWLKVLLIAGIEGAFLERLYFEDRMVGKYRSRAAVSPEGSPERDWSDAKLRRHLNHRRDFTWWTSLFIILSMVDAYVDAHLKRFDVSLQAAPGEETNEKEATPGEGVSLRLALSLSW